MMRISLWSWKDVDMIGQFRNVQVLLFQELFIDASRKAENTILHLNLYRDVEGCVYADIDWVCRVQHAQDNQDPG